MVKNTSDPVGTLSVGNVVTTSTILYKSNFKPYLQVSLRATAWLLAIFISVIALTVISSVLFGITNSWLVFVPAIVGGIVVTFYFLAKHATDRAVICRLAYQELIGAPETAAIATRQLLPRTWGFLRLSILVGLYVFLVAFIGYLALILVVVVVSVLAGFIVNASGSGQLSALNNPLIYFVLGLMGIGLILLWIAVLIRFYASWFIAELPLAIESTTSANFSIRRSSQLSKTAVRRLVLIITVAFLITLPIELLGSIPSFIGQIMTSPTLGGSTERASQGGILILVGSLVSLVAEIFVMPFWQTVKAIVYFDLRNRREGGDLTI